MSMLRSQADELRLTADIISEHGVVSDDIATLEIRLREAADTIISLRNRLQEDGEQTCHATQANYEHCKYSTDRGWRDTSKYAEMFGTPERAARVIAALNNCRVTDCIDCWARGACRYYGCGDDYDALLEWLKGADE